MVIHILVVALFGKAICLSGVSIALTGWLCDAVSWWLHVWTLSFCEYDNS